MKKHFSANTLLMTCIYLNVYAFQAADMKSQPLQAVEINENLSITGKLEDPRWSQANHVELSYEVQPGENTLAPQKTFVKILYNSEFIYFGFDCRDSKPSEIRSHITDRDKVFEDDFIIVLFDTYGDFHRTYEFFVNPHGIQGDILRTGNNEDVSFDAVWYSAAVMNESGWTAEMAIPFKSLRFPSSEQQVWTLLLGRNFPRDSRYIFSWTPLDRNNPCLICQGRPLTGIQNIESTTSVEILPYVIGTQAGSLQDTDDPASPFVNGPLRGRVGGGLKYAPGPALVVEAVANPDFSQVESDAAQISVNTTFALFYPEKRPFFLEGADLLQNRLSIFYSRTINNPIAAAKVTSKTGGLSLSYMAASDRNTPFIIPGEENSDSKSTALKSLTNVVRTRYDLGDESFFGTMVTTRNVSNASNYVAGIDWNYLLASNYYVKGEFFYSKSKELGDMSLFSNSRVFGSSGYNAAFNGESYDGTALRILFLRSARDYNFELQYNDLSPTFQAQQGFVTRTNQRRTVLSHFYNFYPNDAYVDSWFLFNEGGLQFNYLGERKERFAFVGGGIQFKAQTFLFLGYIPFNNEIFKGVLFEHIPRGMVELNFRGLRSLSVFFNGEFGKFIYRSTPELGSGHRMSVRVVMKPTDQLQLDLSYGLEKLSSVANGNLFFDGYVARTNVAYQFNPELFLRVIGQYNQFSRVADFYPLISYKLNPFTIFYAGSTHTVAEFESPHGLTQTSRQFFIKLQYLWRS